MTGDKLRITVIGANGQLGTDIVSAATKGGHEVIALTHAQIDVTDLESVRRSLKTLTPDVVVNTAALHNVEQCELEPERAFAVNARGAENVAVATGELDAAIVHVSTDYVFGREKRTPYLETDAPNPVNVYGESKLAGENLVRSANRHHFVVRTSALYGVARCRAKTSDNFVRLMLRLAKEKGEVRVVTDERVSPTWTASLADQILAVTATDAYGLYHATSQGECSWYEFAETIFGLAGWDVRVRSATGADFPSKVARPPYSVLDNTALRARGLDRMPHWRDALASYLEAIGARPPDVRGYPSVSTATT